MDIKEARSYDVAQSKPYILPSQQSLDVMGKSTDEMIKETGDEREGWGNKWEFILASIGLAVGLGNVWRFPYLCQKNGGGAFLIPYFIFMIIEGIPLFIIEFAIGQRMRRSAINCWKNVHPALTGVGVSCVIVSFMLCIYYVVVIAWCLYYMFVSFAKTLPWHMSSCEKWPLVKNLSGIALRKAVKNVTNDCCLRDPQAYYFYEKALKVSTGIDDLGSGVNGPLVGCLALAWVITYLCIVKGVKSSGKAVYFTATFPYLILVIFFFRGVTLEGAGDGLVTLFKPDFSKLLNARIWLDAATQMFFTLSLGFGALIAFASYMPRKNNCIRDAYTVVLINCGTSIFAGIVVFSILGYRAKKTGIPADEVGGGAGLAFITFCDAFLLMDVSPLWSVLFFMMLLLLGIDSEFGTLEAAVAPLYDMKLIPMRKEFFTALLAVVFFLIGIAIVSSPGFYIFQIFDDYSVALPLLVIALFQTVGISWIYKNERIANDIEYMTGSRPNIFWMLCWKYISPIAIFIVLIASIVETAKDTAKYSAYVGCESKPFSSRYNGTKEWTKRVDYPGWGQFIIAVIVIACIGPVIIWAVFWMIKHWNGTWRSSVWETLTGGWVEYHPDPSWVDPTRRKSNIEMAKVIAEEDQMANRI
ncbi:sodium-dependent neutral amino acid transporter B(0)AT3-like isoform X2 [Rhopilema esculentum]|uniref:sodium-dependent neutral amino acid transporter B(0)AT3-like isoform X2 n=1 Tax=Rhopilema esculentum TaxID=499914 RepID=UPI0031D4BC42|eukprot:gene981-10753_t